MKSGKVLQLPESALDHLMPMHLVVGPTGHITRVGPTFAKLRPETDFIGARLLEVFHIRRPAVTGGRVEDLRKIAGRRLQLEMRDAERTPLPGILVELGGSRSFLLNLSFGVAVLSRLDRFDLSSSDFAPTDQTFEILYLQEAKSIVEAEYRRLTALLKTSKDAAEMRAMTDPLTGLGNRAAMEAWLDELTTSQAVFSLIHLDLDLFKQVNDTHGHAAGDAVLCTVAERLHSALRDTDHINRVGGDEFVILVNGLHDKKRIDGLGADIIRKLERPIPVDGAKCKISGSIGYTVSTFYDAPDAARMLADSDTALYAAKRAGRGRTVAFSPDLGSLGEIAAE